MNLLPDKANMVSVKKMYSASDKRLIGNDEIRFSGVLSKSKGRMPDFVGNTRE